MPALRLNRFTVLAAIALSTLGLAMAEPLVECHERSGLPNVFVSLESGKAVRIAYLGGSITE
jgi:hypothetical protein